jgi:3-isopropylmalate dehydrogenase
MPRPYRLACMLGDGIGPEIVPAARRLVDAALLTSGASVPEWVELPMGAAAIAAHGRAVPTANFAVLADCDGWLAGPHDSQSYPADWHAGTERVPGAELRSRYDLFANIRPCRNRAGVPSLVGGVDLVIVRENSEGLYSDRNMFTGSGEFMPVPGVALSVGVFTRTAIRRIATVAFDLARTRRHHVTIVHKANVMPLAFGLFVDECRAVADAYSDVQVDEYLFDSMAAQLVRRPQQFDVIVTENLFGDTLSDLAGELIGALGMAGSLNAGDHYAMAQAAHGSAPDIAGRDIANPVGMILSAALLLRWLGSRHDDQSAADAGEQLEAAVDAVLEAGIRTEDLYGSATTTEFVGAVADEVAGSCLARKRGTIDERPD